MRQITRKVRQVIAGVSRLFQGERLTCREFTDFLMEYRSGELPTTIRAKFEQHLGTCPHCSAYLRSYEETVKLGKAAFKDLEKLSSWLTCQKNWYRRFSPLVLSPSTDLLYGNKRGLQP